MFRNFRNIVKSHGFRGWRLEMENNEIYISKFDERYNDDEFRFYIEKKDGEIHIYKMKRHKTNNDKIMSVDQKNPYAINARKICQLLETTSDF